MLLFQGWEVGGAGRVLCLYKVRGLAVCGGWSSREQDAAMLAWAAAVVVPPETQSWQTNDINIEMLHH